MGMLGVAAQRTDEEEMGAAGAGYVQELGLGAVRLQECQDGVLWKSHGSHSSYSCVRSRTCSGDFLDFSKSSVASETPEKNTHITSSFCNRFQKDHFRLGSDSSMSHSQRCQELATLNMGPQCRL